MKFILCAGKLNEYIHSLMNQIQSEISYDTCDILMIEDVLDDGCVLLFTSAIETEEDYRVFKNVKDNVELIVLEKDKNQYEGYSMESLSVDSLKTLLNHYSKAKPIEDKETVEKLSRGLVESGIYAVIGHQSVGKSNVVANLGMAFSIQNVRTLIIDLNTITRDMNLYFSGITEQTSDDKNPLLETSKYPDKYHEQIFSVTKNLDVLGLSYHAIDSREPAILDLKQMIVYLSQVYEVILFEVCLDDLLKYDVLLELATQQILVIENHLHSLYKTSSLLKYMFKSDEKIYECCRFRQHLLINKYNDKNSFEGLRLKADKTEKMLCHLSSPFELHFKSIHTLDYDNKHVSRLYTDKALDTLKGKIYAKYLNLINSF